MPIFTPCADAGTLASRLLTAAAAIHIDFIVASQPFLFIPGIFYNPAKAHLFQIGQWY
jgi:hypothetical protein